MHRTCLRDTLILHDASHQREVLRGVPWLCASPAVPPSFKCPAGRRLDVQPLFCDAAFVAVCRVQPSLALLEVCLRQLAACVSCVSLCSNLLLPLILPSTAVGWAERFEPLPFRRCPFQALAGSWQKRREFMNDIVINEIFGTVRAYIYRIQWQVRDIGRRYCAIDATFRR